MKKLQEKLMDLAGKKLNRMTDRGAEWPPKCPFLGFQPMRPNAIKQIKSNTDTVKR